MSTATVAERPTIVTATPKKATPDDVVKAIRRETSCTRAEATSTLRMLKGKLDALRHLRKSGQPDDQLFVHFSEQEIFDHHARLGVIMPDDAATPRTGTAHAAFHEACLEGDELAFVHTRRGEKERVYCAAGLKLRTG